MISSHKSSGYKRLAKPEDSSPNRAFATRAKSCDKPPIIAHVAYSIGAGDDFAARAEPRFWLDVLAEFPTLRICLAHQGRFCHAATRPDGTSDPETALEEEAGAYIAAHPDSNLYIDISYLSHVIEADDDATRWSQKRLAAWREAFDPEARRIVFGTDWIMIGRCPRSAA